VNAASTRHPPRTRARLPSVWLAAAAVLSVAGWLVTEGVLGRLTHPRHAEMLTAARTMQVASRVLVVEKDMRGLMPPRDADPNRTGMIGAEFTPITTTLGDLTSKRTTTNPDFAAALVGQFASLDLPRATPVVIVLSGSFVGANVATIAAAEALALRPIVIASLSASMWGANDLQFNCIARIGSARRCTSGRGPPVRGTGRRIARPTRFSAGRRPQARRRRECGRRADRARLMP
jgi:poly-gamma-glutamate system protein